MSIFKVKHKYRNLPFLAKISFKTPFYVSREYYIIAICALKTKIEDEKILIFIGLKKLRSTKNSVPGLRPIQSAIIFYKSHF